MKNRTAALLSVAFLLCSALLVAATGPYPALDAAATARVGNDNATSTAAYRRADTATAAAQPTATRIPPTATPVPAATSTPVPGGHGALLFGDEFNGAAVDASLWAYPNDGDGLGHAHWAASACTESNGSLHLTAQLIGGVQSSCALWTQGLHEIPAYGYWEMRARIPANSGTWPAFWSVAYNRLTDPNLYVWEIDTMEAIDHVVADQTTISWNLHIRTASGTDDDRAYYAMGAEVYSGYHTYATSWSPGLVIWYVDGIERFRVADPKVPTMSQVAIVQMDLGSYSGPLDPNALPLTMDVDWIHIYANP